MGGGEGGGGGGLARIGAFTGYVGFDVRKRVLPFVAPAACYLQHHRL
jgi:hypothetical protein